MAVGGLAEQVGTKQIVVQAHRDIQEVHFFIGDLVCKFKVGMKTIKIPEEFFKFFLSMGPYKKDVVNIT